MQPIETPEGLRYPSTQKSTRQDVINLEQNFNQALRQRQARASGLCPVRLETTLELADELVRQLFNDQPEAGLLLARVRDEYRQTIAIYQTLYMD